MKKLIIIILLFTGYIYSQQVEPLVADTNSSGVYDVNHIKILGTKNDATHHRLPVDANFTGTIPGVSTYAAQVLLLHIDSLIQTNTKKLADSTAILRAIVNKLISNPSTSIRQDTLLALLKLLGRSNTLPYFVAGTGQTIPTRDSLSGVTPKVIDVRYANGYYPTKVNLTLTNLTGTADTVRIKTWCVAKNDSSYFNVGWKDRSGGGSAVGSPDGNELDNSLIIIPANTSRTFESDGYGKVGIIRIMWKTTAGKTSTKLYISTQKIN